MMNLADLAGLANQVCPMHVLIDAEGMVVSHGPTLHKVRQGESWIGKPIFDLLDLQRPRSVKSVDDLMAVEGIKLHFQLRAEPHTRLKGVLVPLPSGQGAFINLSFGISVLDAVRDFNLTSQDFSPTDLTIEMLYLVEAKSAAMEASRQLNLRLQGAKIAAEEQAFTDTLTGLKNRRAMDHVLNRLVNSGRDFALMHVDLDFFKQVNDTFGHAAGDTVLQRVAAIMVDCTRKSDTVARVGGDEFVLIFEGLLDRNRLNDLANRLIARLEEPIMYGAEVCRISGSAGTVLSSSMARPDPAVLLHQADVALYAAKRAGRAQHMFYLPEYEADMVDHQDSKSA
ncbi:diguanylate cyclase domain-containing protein [Arenibacterium sp. LLYu02]|uniref:diguanylate cyclase domain-containing protein n=1 Tax=Arenibacterium sp. LLYu02 TaxID=3404132 RepID=UPI003B2130AA